MHTFRDFLHITFLSTRDFEEMGFFLHKMVKAGDSVKF